MLISTADWLDNLACDSTTPERRRDICVSTCLKIAETFKSSSWFRASLRQIQQLKSIKMVKKYKDGEGRNRVVRTLNSHREPRTQ